MAVVPVRSKTSLGHATWSREARRSGRDKPRVEQRRWEKGLRRERGAVGLVGWARWIVGEERMVGLRTEESGVTRERRKRERKKVNEAGGRRRRNGRGYETKSDWAVVDLAALSKSRMSWCRPVEDRVRSQYGKGLFARLLPLLFFLLVLLLLLLILLLAAFSLLSSFRLLVLYVGLFQAATSIVFVAPRLSMFHSMFHDASSSRCTRAFRPPLAFATTK